MSNQIPQTYFVQTVLTCFVFLLLAGVVMADPSNEGGEVPFSGLETFYWEGLGPDEYTDVCTFDGGSVVCYDSCPPGSDAICAEFTNGFGEVLLYCCINPESEGSNELEECIREVDLVRSGDQHDLSAL